MTTESVLQKEQRGNPIPRVSVKPYCSCLCDSDNYVDRVNVSLQTLLLCLCSPVFPLLLILFLLLSAMWNSILAMIGTLFSQVEIPTVTTHQHSTCSGRICSQGLFCPVLCQEEQHIATSIYYRSVFVIKELICFFTLAVSQFSLA